MRKYLYIFVFVFFVLLIGAGCGLKQAEIKSPVSGKLAAGGALHVYPNGHRDDLVLAVVVCCPVDESDGH